MAFLFLRLDFIDHTVLVQEIEWVLTEEGSEDFEENEEDFEEEWEEEGEEEQQEESWEEAGDS